MPPNRLTVANVYESAWRCWLKGGDLGTEAYRGGVRCDRTNHLKWKRDIASRSVLYSDTEVDKFHYFLNLVYGRRTSSGYLTMDTNVIS